MTFRFIYERVNLGAWVLWAGRVEDGERKIQGKFSGWVCLSNHGGRFRCIGSNFDVDLRDKN